MKVFGKIYKEEQMRTSTKTFAEGQGRKPSMKDVYKGVVKNAQYDEVPVYKIDGRTDDTTRDCKPCAKACRR